MTKIWSINALVNEFLRISASHKELMSFGYGEEFDIIVQEQANVKFPQLWVEPVNTQLVLTRNSATNQRRFLFYCYDYIRQDEKNVISTWNSCELILTDICRLLNYGSNEYRLINNPILTPITEKYTEVVTGYFCEIVIETPEITGTCEIPYLNRLLANGFNVGFGISIDLETFRS